MAVESAAQAAWRATRAELAALLEQLTPADAIAVLRHTIEHAKPHEPYPVKDTARDVYLSSMQRTGAQLQGWRAFPHTVRHIADTPYGVFPLPNLAPPCYTGRNVSRLLRKLGVRFSANPASSALMIKR
jgi:hypothetical protein